MNLSITYISTVFRFWNVNVIVLWAFFTIRSNAYSFPGFPDRLHERSMNVFDRLRPLYYHKSSEKVTKRSETVRNHERSGTLGVLKQDKRSGTFSKSRLRFKNESITVIWVVDKTYISLSQTLCPIYIETRFLFGN